MKEGQDKNFWISAISGMPRNKYDNEKIKKE